MLQVTLATLSPSKDLMVYKSFLYVHYYGQHYVQQNSY
jgi:hypothetical protein